MTTHSEPTDQIAVPGSPADVDPDRRVDVLGQLLLDPALFESRAELVDAARSILEDECQGALVGTGREPGRLWGVRPDAKFRRDEGEGGRPELRNEQLELARLGVDQRHRREKVWEGTADATMAEVKARCWTMVDLGAMRTKPAAPWWFDMEGSDGKPLVPRHLQTFVAAHYWSFACGTFGTIASSAEYAGQLSCSPRTIRNHRAQSVALGCVARGHQVENRCDGRVRRDSKGRHTHAHRTWRPGTEGRTSDQGKSLWRLGPVIEILGSLAAAEIKAPGQLRARKGARRAAHALRRHARAAAHARVDRTWRRDVARGSATPEQQTASAGGGSVTSPPPPSVGEGTGGAALQFIDYRRVGDALVEARRCPLEVAGAEKVLVEELAVEPEAATDQPEPSKPDEDERHLVELVELVADDAPGWLTTPLTPAEVGDDASLSRAPRRRGSRTSSSRVVPELAGAPAPSETGTTRPARAETGTTRPASAEPAVVPTRSQAEEPGVTRTWSAPAAGSTPTSDHCSDSQPRKKLPCNSPTPTGRARGHRGARPPEEPPTKKGSVARKPAARAAAPPGPSDGDNRAPPIDAFACDGGLGGRAKSMPPDPAIDDAAERARAREHIPECVPEERRVGQRPMSKAELDVYSPSTVFARTIAAQMAAFSEVDS